MTEAWPEGTDAPSLYLSIATSLDEAASSKFGTHTIIDGIQPTATGPAPSNGPYGAGIDLFYFSPNRVSTKSGGVWKVGEYDELNAGSGGGCDFRGTEDRWTKTDGAFRGIKDGVTLQAWDDMCTYRGRTLPTGGTQMSRKQVGKLECDYYRDAVCYDTYTAEGTCEVGQEWWRIMECNWYS